VLLDAGADEEGLVEEGLEVEAGAEGVLVAVGAFLSVCRGHNGDDRRPLQRPPGGWRSDYRAATRWRASQRGPAGWREPRASPAATQGAVGPNRSLIHRAQLAAFRKSGWVPINLFCAAHIHLPWRVCGTLSEATYALGQLAQQSPYPWPATPKDAFNSDLRRRPSG